MRACSQLLANWQHIDRFAQKSVLAKRFDANKHKMTDATRKKQHISFSILTQQESKRSVINTMRFLKREQKATSGIQAMVKRQEEPKRKPMMALQQQPAQSVDCSPKGFLRPNTGCSSRLGTGGFTFSFFAVTGLAARTTRARMCKPASCKGGGHALTSFLPNQLNAGEFNVHCSSVQKLQKLVWGLGVEAIGQAEGGMQQRLVLTKLECLGIYFAGELQARIRCGSTS
eukprot:scaffold96754_cov17-Tisochrysis_lutea.AAC.1